MPRKRKAVNDGSAKGLKGRIESEVLARAKSSIERLPETRRRPDLLLLPNIPKPLHGVAPRVVLGPSWWNKERKKAYESTEFHCLACGVPKSRAEYHQWLEGHEVYEIDYAKGRATYIRTVPLCHFCHNYIHDGRLKSLLDQGKVHHAKYAAIIRHGDKVLAEVGLSKPTYAERVARVNNTRTASWAKWRMVIHGIEYPPLYRDIYDWAAHHGYSSLETELEGYLIGDDELD